MKFANFFRAHTNFNARTTELSFDPTLPAYMYMYLLRTLFFRARIMITRRRTRQNPHVCPYIRCNRAFPTATALSRHEATHNADKPHKCPRCTLCFATIAQLDAHARLAHESRPPKRKRTNPEDEALLLAPEQEEKGAPGGDDEMSEEVAEIVENGAYLAKQMKVARVC